MKKLLLRIALELLLWLSGLDDLADVMEFTQQPSETIIHII